jgi:hypothetical protein
MIDLPRRVRWAVEIQLVPTSNSSPTLVDDLQHSAQWRICIEPSQMVFDCFTLSCAQRRGAWTTKRNTTRSLANIASLA